MILGGERGGIGICRGYLRIRVFSDGTQFGEFLVGSGWSAHCGMSGKRWGVFGCGGQGLPSQTARCRVVVGVSGSCAGEQVPVGHVAQEPLTLHFWLGGFEQPCDLVDPMLVAAGQDDLS
jgi:hypothetical protein